MRLVFFFELRHASRVGVDRRLQVSGLLLQTLDERCRFSEGLPHLIELAIQALVFRLCLRKDQSCRFIKDHIRSTHIALPAIGQFNERGLRITRQHLKRLAANECVNSRTRKVRILVHV